MWRQRPTFVSLGNFESRAESRAFPGLQAWGGRDRLSACSSDEHMRACAAATVSKATSSSPGSSGFARTRSRARSMMGISR